MNPTLWQLQPKLQLRSIRVAIKVYGVDDSAVVRQTLMHLLRGDP